MKFPNVIMDQNRPEIECDKKQTSFNSLSLPGKLIGHFTGEGEFSPNFIYYNILFGKVIIHNVNI